MVDTLITYFYNMIFFGILAWYMDNILSQNRGVPRPWYFPFKFSFWCSILEKNQSTLTIDNVVKNTKQTDTYQLEKNQIINDEKKNKRNQYFDGLRAIGLSKTYKSIDT